MPVKTFIDSLAARPTEQLNSYLTQLQPPVYEKGALEQSLMAIPTEQLTAALTQLQQAPTQPFSGARQPERSTMSIASPYDKRDAEIARQTLPQMVKDLAMFGANFAPGSGEYLSAQQSVESTAKARKAIDEGNYLEASAQGLDAVVNAVGSIPIAHQIMALGKGAVGVAKGLMGAEHIIPAITTYHGSPTSGIRKWDLNFRGTGEGRLPVDSPARESFTDMIGHGLYSAEKEGIAKGYQDRLTDYEFNRNILRQMYDDLAEQQKQTKEWKAKLRGADASDADKRFLQHHLNREQSLREQIAEQEKRTKPGALYTTELTPHPDEFLLWDKPLSEQSEKVREQLKAAKDLPKIRAFLGGMRGTSFVDAANMPHFDGKDFYQEMQASLGSDKAASEYLNSLGIRGIKYLDNPSRGAGEGTYNYVMFNPAEEAIITHENGKRIPGAVEEAYRKLRDPKSKAMFEERYPELKAIEISKSSIPKSQKISELSRLISAAAPEEKAAIGKLIKEVQNKSQEAPKQVYSSVKEGGPTFQSALVNAFDDPSFPKGSINGPKLYNEFKRRGVTDAEINQVYGDLKAHGVNDIGQWKAAAEQGAIKLGEDLYGGPSPHSFKPAEFSGYRAIKSQEGVVPESYTEEFVTAGNVGKHGILPGDSEPSVWSDFEKSWSDEHTQYSSTQNPMIRLRYDVKEYPDGRKTLRLQEIQTPKEVQKSRTNAKELFEKERFDKTVSWDDLSKDIQESWQEKADSRPVPHELATRAYDMGIKQAVAKAKQMGLDGIEWSTGEQQRDLYNSALRNVADEARWNPQTEELTLFKNGLPSQVQSQIPKRVPKDKLEDYIGKAGAERLLGSDIRGLKRNSEQVRFSHFPEAEIRLRAYQETFPKRKYFIRKNDDGSVSVMRELENNPEHIATDLSIDAKWPGKLYGDFAENVRETKLVPKTHAELYDNLMESDNVTLKEMLYDDDLIRKANEWGVDNTAIRKAKDYWENDNEAYIDDAREVESDLIQWISQHSSDPAAQKYLFGITTNKRVKVPIDPGDFNYSATVPSLLKKYGKGEFGVTGKKSLSSAEKAELEDLQSRLSLSMKEIDRLDDLKMKNTKDYLEPQQPVMWFTKDTPKSFNIYTHPATAILGASMAAAGLLGGKDDTVRNDGTKKGNGYFGPLPMQDGSNKIATEIAVGVNINGKEVEIPTLVPILTASEIDYLLKGKKPTPAIMHKAVEHARMRMKRGLSPFASSGDLQ